MGYSCPVCCGINGAHAGDCKMFGVEDLALPGKHESGIPVGVLCDMVAAPLGMQMPAPFDNAFSLARFRCAHFNVAIKTLPLQMMALHWPEVNV